MSDWDFEMWWDAVNGMEEENCDDMDDQQASRPTNFPQNKNENGSCEVFSYV